ncbi:MULTISPECIES: hypothetical protein [unclassified Pseudomonas]|uniref:hypothetical protein n=1 Tax=unclassified Pseudomonas TaxID=196821 RepID=UPI0009537BE9|nr:MULTISPECIES: hypothetical protein [unclassified Pseudomonas]SIR68176.1 hypothetical protein SAMN05216504_1846 [Pseudomonas sp. A214]
MSRSNIFGRGVSLCRAVAVFALLLTGVPTANALTREISAVFRPDPAKPQENKFRNTTPTTGYCASFPNQCKTMFSIRLPITFSSTLPIEANHGDARQGAMFKVPAGWRSLQVTHASTGETEVVEIRLSGIGSEYRLPVNAADLVGGGVDALKAHNLLWGSSWVSAPSPCRFGGNAPYNVNWYGFFWTTPVEGVCAKRARYLIPSMTYRYLDFAYELRTPNPLTMSTGQYTGSLTYSVGPGQDFDMGDVMIPNDSIIAFNFKLDVEHTLKVEVPPGGNKVVLEPQGGWQAWLSQGQKPTRLFRDQTFHISASSRFKMGLQCQFAGSSDNTCLLWAPNSGQMVPVNISVTLPNGLTDAGGQPVNRRRLYLDGSGTELFQPGHYIERRPGTMHFEVARNQVEEMLAGDAKSYIGNVTVIWDSEV